MLKEVATYVVIGTVGFACLGILALVMARDALKEMDIGSSN
jgi:hypothetical protein